MWNQLPFSKPGCLEAAVNECNHFGIQIAGLTETRIMDSDELIVDSYAVL